MPETNPGTVTDPHCTGFFGEKFDFMGDDGKYYCMLSTGTLQINSRMKAVTKSDFTFIDEIGVTIGSQETGLTHIKMGLDIESDGQSIALLDKHTITRNPIYFSTGLKSKDGNVVMGSVHLETETLYVNAGSCIIKICRVTQDEEMGDIPHLDMHLEVLPLGMLSDGVMPHGVLGQTVDKDRVKPKGLLGKGIHEGVYRLHEADCDAFMKQGFRVVEGNYKDYEVSGPFAQDFPHNRFGTKPTVLPVYGKCSTLGLFCG